jgi:hypothetical protein
MKKIVLLNVLVLISSSVFSQEVVWALHTENPGFTSKLTVDKSSNLYQYGLNSSPYSSVQGTSIKKYSPSGSLIFDIKWPGKIYLTQMLNDGKGYFYFTGFFEGSVNTNNILLNSNGKTDACIGKMNEQGQVSWAIGFGGAKDDRASSLTFNNDSTEIVITGGVDSTVYVYNYAITTTKKAVFVASFNLSGGLTQERTYTFQPDTYGDNLGLEITNNGNGYYLLADRKGDTWANYPPSGSPLEGRYLFSLDHSLNISWSQYIISSSCYYGYNCANMSACNGDAYVPKFCSGKYGGNGELQRLNAQAGAQTWMMANTDGAYNDTYACGSSVFYVGNEEANGCPCPDNNPGYGKVKMVNANNEDHVLFKAYAYSFYNITRANNGTIYVYGYTNIDPAPFGSYQVQAGYFLFALKDPASGIRDIQGSVPYLAVYPNPSQGSIYIKSEKQIDEITLFNMSGSAVRHFAPGTMNSSLRELSAGCYVLQVRCGDEINTGKVIVSN